MTRMIGLLNGQQPHLLPTKLIHWEDQPSRALTAIINGLELLGGDIIPEPELNELFAEFLLRINEQATGKRLWPDLSLSEPETRDAHTRACHWRAAVVRKHGQPTNTAVAL